MGKELKGHSVIDRYSANEFHGCLKVTQVKQTLTLALFTERGDRNWYGGKRRRAVDSAGAGGGAGYEGASGATEVNKNSLMSCMVTTVHLILLRHPKEYWRSYGGSKY